MAAARPRFMEATRAQGLKSSMSKESRLPFMVIWCVDVHLPVGW